MHRTGTAHVQSWLRIRCKSFMLASSGLLQCHEPSCMTTKLDMAGSVRMQESAFGSSDNSLCTICVEQFVTDLRCEGCLAQRQDPAAQQH